MFGGKLTDENNGCLCSLPLWGRLANEIQFVEVTYGKFAKILPKFENLSVSESRRGPDRETNEINLGCVEHNTTGHLVTHLVSFQYITCRVAAICTTYYSMLYFNFPRFEFQPFMKLFLWRYYEQMRNWCPWTAVQYTYLFKAKFEVPNEFYFGKKHGLEWNEIVSLAIWTIIIKT